MSYYGIDLKGADLPFNFLLLQCAWTAEAVKQVIFDYYSALPSGAWANWVLGNHDQPRIATRIGTCQARIAAMLLFTLPGTLTMYYGEELGMENVPIAFEEVQDPAEKNEPGLGLGRDPVRTPMPWDDSVSAGFTTGQPWLPLGDDYERINVVALEKDPTSILHLYRSLIDLRRRHPTLVTGRLESLAVDTSVLRYERTSGEQRFAILLNMGADPVMASVEQGTVLISTQREKTGQMVEGLVELRGAEGLVIAVNHR